MSDKDRQRTEQLTALAASTTYPGERTVALAQVARIAAKYTAAVSADATFTATAWAARMASPTVNTFTAWL